MPRKVTRADRFRKAMMKAVGDTDWRRRQCCRRCGVEPHAGRIRSAPRSPGRTRLRPGPAPERTRMSGGRVIRSGSPAGRDHAPGMSAEDILAELHAIRRDVVVLLCSGYSAHEVSGRFAGQRVAGVVPKPYSMQTLTASIAQCLHETH
jgi:hypothetical protein